MIIIIIIITMHRYRMTQAWTLCHFIQGSRWCICSIYYENVHVMTIFSFHSIVCCIPLSIQTVMWNHQLVNDYLDCIMFGKKKRTKTRRKEFKKKIHQNNKLHSMSYLIHLLFCIYVSCAWWWIYRQPPWHDF